MKKISLHLFQVLVVLTSFFLSPLICFAQNDLPVPEKTGENQTGQIIEQQLESLTEANEDEETEDDSYSQALQHYLRDPLNLNATSLYQLQEFRFLSPVQISTFFSYKKLLGDFSSIYELQAIPAWDIITIKKILPFITVTANVNLRSSLQARLKGGDQSVMLRLAAILEMSRGYRLDASTANNFYPGNPAKMLLRYKYQFKNLLQYGFTAEKDAGEQFFRGAQRQGFDFYSAHFFARQIGIIKTIAVGDFSVNMGQGLTMWQSLAFKKSVDISSIKRQAEILRPYNSANEILFNRGAGITLQKKGWQITAFASFRKIDANLVLDTLNAEAFVSSLQTSGYHRTRGEVADKNAQRQFTVGGNLSWSNPRFSAGLNAVHYNFQKDIQRTNVLYNRFAIAGSSAGNYSIDYGYTFSNMHLFGEAAVNENFDKAFLNGLLINVDARVTMSFLYRNISRGYQALYGNAFTENTYPVNESGLYSGISITPLDFLRIDAYADFYKFPWIKYRVDAPSNGQEYLLQATYFPSKRLEWYVRFKTESKAINFNPQELPLNPVIKRPKQNMRSQVRYKFNRNFTSRSRVELLWFDRKSASSERGYLVFSDIIFKPLLKPYSGNIRLQYFHTDSYSSRLYAYENDVLYSYSIPVFFDQGIRYYINMNYDLSKNLSLWLRVAQTLYTQKDGIGSGLDYIEGNKRTEFRVQVISRF